MFRNIGSGWLASAMHIAVTFFLLPYVLHTLGEESYGIWLLVSSIITYLNQLLLGVPMASVRYMSQHLAEGDRHKTNQVIGTCAGFYLLIGGTALLLGAGLFVFFDFTYEIPEALRLGARLAFGLMVVHILVSFFLMLPYAIMLAHQRLVVISLVEIASLVLRLGLTLGLLAVRASIVVLAVVQITCLAFESSFHWFLIRRWYPGIRIKLSDFDWSTMRQVFSFSIFVVMLSAGWGLSFQTDSLVIGAWLGVGQIPFFAVGSSTVMYLTNFFTNALQETMMPVATQLKTQGQEEELRTIFLRWSKIAFSFTILAGLFLIVLGPRFIGWWIGPSYERPAGEVLQILMSSALLFLPAVGVAQPILMGLGKPAWPATGFLIAGVLNLILSLLLVGPLGLQGVALGTAVPNMLFAVFLVVLTSRELKVPLLEYVRYVALRVVIGAVAILPVLLWFKLALDVRGPLGLAGAGLATVFVFGALWVFFVYRNDPYLDLRGQLARLVEWSKARVAFLSPS